MVSFSQNETCCATRKKRQAQVNAKSHPLKNRFNSGVSAVLTWYLDTRTTSDALKVSSFQIITERHIPAIRHGEPIEAPPI